jgi:mannan endo-1,4-beta-mannosidase
MLYKQIATGRMLFLAGATVLTLALAAQAQTLTDIGAGNPTPGGYDISQLSTNGNQSLTSSGGFNYFTDNTNPPGQTFTTGNNPLVLTSVAIRTGTSPLNSGSGGLGPQAYQLRLYSVSAGSAGLLGAAYTSPTNFSYVDGHWVRWGTLFVGLATNTTYAYTFARVSTGWDGLAVASGNPYAGGEAALIPPSGGTVTFQSSHGFDAVFDISLSPPQINEPANSTFTLEAENSLLTGSTYVSASASGYSGTGYVDGFQNTNDTVNWSFIATPGLYDLTIRYRTPYGPKGYGGSFNGHGFSGSFPATNNFVSIDAGLVQVIDGVNTLTIGGGWNWYQIDAATLTPVSAPTPPAPVPATLVDPLATFAARSLMASLVADYGQHTWSGLHEATDISYIQGLSAREPAIIEGDLINYSPSRVERGGMPVNYTESCIAQDGVGHVLGFCWHWNAPTNLIDTTSEPWWSGFYTAATTFDVAAALANTNSVEYSLLLRDIDAIAVQLRKVSSNNIPVLWRPLHEASGGWFWWGAKGSGPFKQLWRLVYNRLTVYNNLHNLIWVLTNEDPNWYPGNDVVDIVGVDAYPSDQSDALSPDWQALKAQFDGVKLLTLSEFGGVPDIERMHVFGVWWSYFASWVGTVQSTPTATVTRVYQSSQVITLDDLNAVPPAITSSGPIVGGAFPLSGTGPRGSTYHVLASSDLALQMSSWSALTNGTFAGGVFTFTDPQTANYPQQFYRIVKP